MLYVYITHSKNYSDGDPHIWGVRGNVHRGIQMYTHLATVTDSLITR